MSDVARPVPEDGELAQEVQATLIRRTGDGVAVPNELEELEAEWGEPEDGIFAPNAEAVEVFGKGERA